MSILNLIGRSSALFDEDIKKHNAELENIINKSRFLVIGGAGSIGQAVTKEIFKRNPFLLHVVDISENNLVELVRDIRSTLGYIKGDFKTFAIDCGSSEYEALINDNSHYDYILNLSALKHVRSEKDPYTLMRLIQVNILNTINTIHLSKKNDLKKYFCVSTDKAANPVNMMGASKRIMEMFLIKESDTIDISTARFANVAFSDGSLLHGFNNRFSKLQPIAAPNDIKRYFLTPQESGELCLMSCILGENRDIYFPKLNDKLHMTYFSEIAKRYVNNRGYEVHECESEDEARSSAQKLISQGKWPCYFFQSDTSGEKEYEEFYTDSENITLDKYQNIGIVKNTNSAPTDQLNEFIQTINKYKINKSWNKLNLLDEFNKLITNFDHIEKNKYLDDKM